MFRRLYAFFALSVFVLALTGTPQPTAAQTPPAGQPAKHSAVRLTSPVSATGDLAEIPATLQVTLDRGWKTYWRTPGDAGLAPVITHDGSDNIKDVTILYPAPHRFTIYDIDNFGYDTAVAFPLLIAPETAGAALSARFTVDLLVCSDICIPEKHEVSLDLPAGIAASSPHADIHAAALAALPAARLEGVRFESATLGVNQENRTTLTIAALLSSTPARDADLFVETTGSDIGFGRPAITHDSKTGQARFVSIASTTTPYETLREQLAGKELTLTYVDGAQSVETTLELTTAPAAPAGVGAAATATDSRATGAPLVRLSLQLIFYAFLGGLILNLMPCVLPVLSLKVLSVISHGGAKTDAKSRRKVFVNFMASAAGITSSFWLIAAGLLALKLAGESIGWGIQFQHPAFLIFLIVVILAFAFNMLGLYEIPLPRFIAQRVGRKRDDTEPTITGHFLTGAFATLLATPCTAPFLGTAIGFALAGSALDIFTIFTFLGLGLAAPYILLALAPRLFKFLPKPGAWMVTLRRILAVALLATAAWLASTLYTVTTQTTLDAGWQKFDQALIAPAVADGHVVFVDITADWCLTCKANKRLVLDQDDVKAMLDQPHILRLQGDWTQRDESIAAYLRSFGRFGIPFNVVYGPAAPQGIVLPELLSRRAVSDALTLATGE